MGRADTSPISPHLLQGLGAPAPLLTLKGVPVHGVLARFRSLPLVLQIRLHRSDLGVRIRGGQQI